MAHPLQSIVAVLVEHASKEPIAITRYITTVAFVGQDIAIA